MKPIHDWDVPMFPVPKKYRAPQRPDKWPRWRRYTGKRTTCDDCILDIAKGVRLSVSKPAGHTREDEKGRRFYCNLHAADRMKADGQ